MSLPREELFGKKIAKFRALQILEVLRIAAMGIPGKKGLQKFEGAIKNCERQYSEMNSRGKKFHEKVRKNGDIDESKLDANRNAVDRALSEGMAKSATVREYRQTFGRGYYVLLRSLSRGCAPPFFRGSAALRTE